MSEDLTNDQIALLCDIGEFDLSKASPEQKRNLERLIAEGFVDQTEAGPGSPLKLTAKGTQFLGARGAGLNES